MKSFDLQSLGNFRGAPRFYKQGKRLALAGFEPGVRFSAELVKEQGLVVLKVDTSGNRVVSKKLSGETEVPVIDINSAELLSVFDGMDQIRVIVKDSQIVLLALATEVRRKARIDSIKAKLESGEPLTVGSTSHGAGILSHAIHHGLKEAGITSELVFANDIDPDYLAQAAAHNDAWTDQTIPVAAPLQEFAFDELAMGMLPEINILEAGLPCTAASVAGRAKKGLSMPENDEKVGHLIVGFLNLIVRTNPAVVILENVSQYLATASYAIYKTQMADFGYEVQDRILEGKDFGSLENRKRMCSIAVTRGMAFDFDSLELPLAVQQTVGDILDAIATDDPMWSEMSYLKIKEQRDLAEGKNFTRQEVHATDTHVPTVTRGYMKRRSTDPMLVHPENPNLLRLFTPEEHARLKRVPEHLIAGMSATRAHEVLGQGVCYAPFFAVGKLIGKSLKNWFGANDQLAEAAPVARGWQFELALAA